MSFFRETREDINASKIHMRDLKEETAGLVTEVNKLKELGLQASDITNKVRKKKPSHSNQSVILNEKGEPFGPPAPVPGGSSPFGTTPAGPFGGGIDTDAGDSFGGSHQLRQPRKYPTAAPGRATSGGIRLGDLQKIGRKALEDLGLPTNSRLWLSAWIKSFGDNGGKVSSPDFELAFPSYDQVVSVHDLLVRSNVTIPGFIPLPDTLPSYSSSGSGSGGVKSSTTSGGGSRISNANPRLNAPGIDYSQPNLGSYVPPDVSGGKSLDTITRAVNVGNERIVKSLARVENAILSSSLDFRRQKL